MSPTSHKYRLIEVLGQGGFGTVYRALQIDLGREVACKVARTELLEDDACQVRFHREMEACAALSHPNIVKIFDFGRLDDGRLFYAMELLDAADLEAFTGGRGPLAIADAASYLAQAADALAHLHERRMVHRDVKPSNLMVDRQGRLVLMDFSVVWIDGRTQLTRPGETPGTLLYLPPEAFGEQPVERPSTDVYSLGLTFWEVLAGRRFHEGKPITQVLEELRRRSVPPVHTVRPDTPRWLSALLERCLSPDPGVRPTSADILETCRQRAAPAPRALPARSVGKPPSTSRPVAPATRRWRVRHSLAAAALAASVLACGLWRWSAVPGGREPAATTTHHAPPTLLPGFRRLTIALESPAEPGSTFELGTGQQLIARGVLDRTRRSVTFDRLPADRTCRSVTVLPGGRVAPGSVEVRLPRVVPVDNFLLVPSDTSALVDFDLREPAQVTVTLHRPDEPAPVGLAREHGRRFHKVFTGLSPATTYEVRLSGQGVWVGLADHPFTTRDAAYGRRRADWVSRLDGLTTGLDGLLARPDFDAALVDPILWFLQRGGRRSRDSVSLLAWLTRHLRDPRLAEVLSKELFDDTRDPVGRADALMWARHPRAGSLALKLFESAVSREGLYQAADILTRRGDRRTCDLVSARCDLVRGSWLDAEWLIRCDRSRARECFERWLGSDPTDPDSRMREAISGLVLLGDDEALGAVARGLSSGWPTAVKVHAARCLAGAGGSQVRGLLADLARQSPDPSGYLWPLARCATADDTTVFETLLARSTVPRIRQNAALILGYVKARTSAPVLRKALGDPDATVVQAAAWATGQIRDRVAAPALELLVTSGRDAGGVAAHALGTIGHTESVPALRASMLSRLASKSHGDLAALGPTVHALISLTGGAARGEIEAAVSAARVPPFVQEFVRTLLAGPATSTCVVILPQAPFVRTGLRCYPGDWVEIRGHGFWSYEGQGQLLTRVTARTAEPGRGRPRLRLSAIVGRQKWPLEDAPERVVVESEGELELTAFEGATVLDRHAGSWEATHGMGLATIRSSAAGVDAVRLDRPEERPAATPPRSTRLPGPLVVGFLGLLGVVLVAIGRARLARPEAGTSRVSRSAGVETPEASKPAAAGLTESLAQRYADLTLIGTGLTGQVFRGRDRRLGRLVAIKVLDPLSVSTPEGRSRFLRGARSLASLSHPNLVQVHDISTTGHLFYTTEWVDGESLAELVRKRGPLPPADALAVMSPIAQVLALCHIRGIVHRDLKPEKILVDSRGSPRLTGFGRAFVDTRTRLTRAGSLPACSRHAPPEQREGARPSPTVDVHAFGSILSEIVSGPGDLAGLITACTDRDPARRPADGTALVERLTGLSKRVQDREVELASFLDRLEEIVAADLHSLKNRLRLVDGASCTEDLRLVRERLAAIVPPSWMDPVLVRRLEALGPLLAGPDVQGAAQAHREALSILEAFQVPFREALDQVARRYMGRGVVKVTTDLPPPPVRTCDVLSARSDLELIVTNLADNAFAAGASEVEITLGTAEPREEAATIQVTDDGPGFAPEDRKKALLAAFPERGPGRGTGLLTIVQVARHRGWRLELVDSPRTTFVLMIPGRSSLGP